MVGNTQAAYGYKSINSVWNNQQKNTTEYKTNDSVSSDTKLDNNVKVSAWNPVNPSSSLVPVDKDGYGMSIGEVKLSDKAKSYYEDLKKKFGNMDFILVSSDMKSKVASHASSYGSANKSVVLIDDAKIEMMANDESVRKKYEGIISMSQAKMQEARNSLTSSGAIVKSLGMSVSEDGKVSFFAVIEKNAKENAKALSKRQAAKKEAKKKEEKKAEKEDREEKLEKMREEKKQYLEFKPDSLESLVDKISKYAFNEASESVVTNDEKRIGQLIDFKG